MKNTICSEKLTRKTIRNIFESGCKSREDFKIGIEYERIPVDEFSRTVSYHGENGICVFLKEFAKIYDWEYIFDAENIIGLKKDHDTITLEPGCQIELSVEPQKTIFELKSKLEELSCQLNHVAKSYDFKLLSYGVSPLSTHKMIHILPKRRYGLMANYLWGILSDVMMRETAGIQICLDFESEFDAMRKFRVANLISPVVTAMFANSPIRGGVDTGYKSFRALAWLNTDNERCGFATSLTEDINFDDYIDSVMNVPMIFLTRNNKNLPLNGTINFSQFYENGYLDFEPTIDDFKLHANLYFPDVRLRKFIEIRNHDCISNGCEYSLAALYKGIFYSQDALTEVENLFSKFSYDELMDIRYEIPKFALKAKMGNLKVLDYAKELLEIAHYSLVRECNNEENFLEPIYEMTAQGLCPADLVLKNWYGSWNKDLKKLISYYSS